jgi:hypothetical protein
MSEHSAESDAGRFWGCNSRSAHVFRLRSDGRSWSAACGVVMTDVRTVGGAQWLVAPDEYPLHLVTQKAHVHRFLPGMRICPSCWDWHQTRHIPPASTDAEDA